MIRAFPAAGAAAAHRRVAVVGVGLWTPESGSAGAAAGGDGARARAATTGQGTPAIRPRRRASLLTQIAAAVAVQAAEQGGVSLSEVPVVMGSGFGEMATTIDLLKECETSGDLSPTRFHNSVHNNAAAHLSITHQNRDFSTSIAAGHETVAMVLLEAVMLLHDRGGHVLAIVADEPLPALLLHDRGTPAVGAALLLAADPTDGRGGGR
ncbi:MAG: beta-ketoacyl synthase chain length factor, partial [Pseudomonadota bacterium]